MRCRLYQQGPTRHMRVSGVLLGLSQASTVAEAMLRGGRLCFAGPRRHVMRMSTGASSQPKVVVFGGNGFVGSRVVQAALSRGASVVSINRSGQPKSLSEAWVTQVKWVSADIFDSSSYKGELQGAAGVVSCVGAFGSNEFMEKINGDANIRAVETAAQEGVPRFVYVSTVENNLPDVLLKGYFNGKRRAEQAVLTMFPETGVVLRPSFIYGTRQVGSKSLPLGLVGKPLEMMLRLPPFPTLKNLLPGAQAILAPPVAVEAVGSVAAAAAMGDKSVPAGILKVDDIARLARTV